MSEKKLISISRGKVKRGSRRYSPSEKKEILSLYESGVSVTKLMGKFGVSDASIYNWAKKKKEILASGKPEIEAFVSRSKRPRR